MCPTGLCMPAHGVCTAGPTPGPCDGCPERGVRGAADVRTHRAASRMVAANIPVSDYLHSRLGLPRSRRIYSPVSSDAFAAANYRAGEDGLVAFAGRLVAEKGLDTLLRALALVPDAELLVVGDGPMMPAYRDLTHELGLSLRVSFLGSQPFDGVAQAYARASVVCVPTMCEEAFGFAAAEAMAMSRPLVVSPSGALAELCADNRGFLADDRSPQALATTLREVLGDDAERAARAKRARTFADQWFTQDRAGSEYEAVYEAVAS